MGRWAQRTRCGGGKSINFMTAAQEIGSTELRVTFLDAVTAAEFGTSDFDTTPGEFEPSGFSNFAPNVLDITFNDSIESETDLNYLGLVPGILANHSVPITH